MKSFEAKKIYYSIGEVSKISGLPQYLLRHWETEFPQLTPARNVKGNRTYTNKDIAVILSIKNLIYEQGYTAEKAKVLMQDLSSGGMGNPMQESQTESLLKAHQDAMKHQATPHTDGRRKETLLAAKSLIEDLLERFGQ
ncbi:MAG: MerR family transcriptional regulator [Rhizobacter sp.]|nr:MerR family transcriptional regulator [Chlorobiales bacterium]